MDKTVYVAGFVDKDKIWHPFKGGSMPEDCRSRKAVCTEDGKLILQKNGVVLDAKECVFANSAVSAKKKLMLMFKETEKETPAEAKPLVFPCEKKAIAYTDGSYNKNFNRYGYGVFLLIDGQEEEFYGGDTDTTGGWQVNGEIYAVLLAVTEAIEKGCTAIEIRYDYEGVRAWADGLWKTNRQYTAKYAKAIHNYRKKITISFKHIPSHTGDAGNERADGLAKRGAGIDIGDEIRPVRLEKESITEKDTMVSEACRHAIKMFYKKNVHKFKDFMMLKTGGRDGYSSMPDTALRAVASDDGFLEQVETELEDDKQQATAIRWKLRGLTVEDAIHKVKVDAEVSENARRGRFY